jgi:hypothetical protein
MTRLRGAFVGCGFGIVAGAVLAFVVASLPNPGADSADERLEYAFYGFFLIWPGVVLVSILAGVVLAGILRGRRRGEKAPEDSAS